MTHTDPGRLAYWLLKDVNKAIRDFNMIQDGDHVAVAVSGGKDSLTLLDLLAYRLKSTQNKYTLSAIHILGDTDGPGKVPHLPLVDWFVIQDYNYAIRPLSISPDETLPMNCHRCSWNRRRTLFDFAHQIGANKVALGHTADDLAQTTLLNLLTSGKVETMAPTRVYFGGQFVLIRPLCYLPEKNIRRFSITSQHPTPPPSCPRSDHTRRQQVEDLIRQAESWCPDVRNHLLKAGLDGIRYTGNKMEVQPLKHIEPESNHGDSE
jgi:tRNA 2-thiocytidine biosynthesis protein TtcA